MVYTIVYHGIQASPAVSSLLRRYDSCIQATAASRPLQFDRANELTFPAVKTQAAPRPPSCTLTLPAWIAAMRSPTSTNAVTVIGSRTHSALSGPSFTYMLPPISVATRSSHSASNVTPVPCWIQLEASPPHFINKVPELSTAMR